MGEEVRLAYLWGFILVSLCICEWDLCNQVHKRSCCFLHFFFFFLLRLSFQSHQDCEDGNASCAFLAREGKLGSVHIQSLRACGVRILFGSVFWQISNVHIYFAVSKWHARKQTSRSNDGWLNGHWSLMGSPAGRKTMVLSNKQYWRPRLM